MIHFKHLNKLRKGICIPCLILLVLFILASFSKAGFIDNFDEGYRIVEERYSASYVTDYPEKYSDIRLTISNLNVNSSTEEVEYSFLVTAWLDVNVTEIRLLLRTYSTYHDVLLYRGDKIGYDSETGEWWGWYYEIEEPIYIKEKVSGSYQGYPYDAYSIKIWLDFSIQTDPTFHEDFSPEINVNPISDWNTECYSKPLNFDGLGVSFDVGINIARDTTVAVLQFMIPTLAIYLIMGYSTYNDASFKLKEKISLFLTISVLTLSLYTFLLRQFDNIPLIVQNIAISLVVSNIILFVFSIISTSKKSNDSDLSLWALFLASITPIIYLILSANSLMNYFRQVVIVSDFRFVLILFERYLDYRFTIWLIIFQLAFWTAYLSKTYIRNRSAIGFFMLASGVGIFLINLTKFDFSQEMAFYVLSVIIALIGVFFILKSKKKFFESKLSAFTH